MKALEQSQGAGGAGVYTGAVLRRCPVKSAKAKSMITPGPSAQTLHVRPA